jgi:uncharacterized protein (DUF169 family)
MSAMTDPSDPTSSTGERARLAERLAGALHLAVAPVSISFHDVVPEGVDRFEAPMSAPTADGRSGRVPAGCVFWVHGATRTFATVPEDHGNCSVGRFTHGMASLEDVAGNADVAALLESGWVTPEAVGTIPSIATEPGSVVYGPLAEDGPDPDVVLMRVNGRQMMVLSDAMPGMRIEGKPQCHIVAIAKEHGEVAASVGCALSRARTGMRPEEMTVAVPGARLAEVVDAVERTAQVDSVVAKYAAEDARRFK